MASFNKVSIKKTVTPEYLEVFLTPPKHPINAKNMNKIKETMKKMHVYNYI